MNSRNQEPRDLTDALEEIGEELGLEVGTSLHYYVSNDYTPAHHESGYGASFDDEEGGNHTFDFSFDPRKFGL